MKRRRRIEITRYSRRITVLQGEPAVSDAAAEQQAGDLILEILDGIPPTRADCDGSVSGDVAADYLPRRRPFFSLRDLLRLCKRG
ncbi:MAG: hypothetical protein LC672_04030 [Acidobacteria bacterium]|nr:hypothetical protein [Acidobacteriota bacterium]